MTRDQDIERVLEQWFAEGPTQMPSRFLDDTLDRIDRAPRGRLAGLRPRLLAMKPDLRLAAAAAVVLFIAGIGLTMLSRAPAVGVGPSPTPTAIPSTSGQVVVDPAILQSTWASVGMRQTPGGCCPNPYTFDIAGATLTVPELKADVLSSISLVGPDRFELRVLGASGDWRCLIGDTGTYTTELSSDGLSLTLAPIQDACSARATILTGGWARTDMGKLAPGAHSSKLFKPFDDAGGHLSYTVGAGWEDSWECAYCLTLGKSTTSATSAGSLVSLLSNLVPTSLGPRCDHAVAGVGPTAAGIAEWLRTLPDLVVTTPTPVTIGGLSGVTVDVSPAPASSTSSCPFLLDGSGSITLTDPDAPRPEDVALSVSATGTSRYILLDRGDGRTLLIELQAQDKTTLDALVRDVTPVINTFEFVR
jgi:hypothetical protein